MDHASGFWHFAVHFWYGWWPYVPLTFIIAVVCAIILVWLARENTQEYYPKEERWSASPWRWPATIFAAVLGFGLWPLAALVLLVLLTLLCIAICPPTEEVECLV